MCECKCGQQLENCFCKDAGAIPLKCTFTSNGLEKQEEITEVRQRRGEAELSVIDWVVHSVSQLKPGDAVLTIATSGDIDTVVAAIFAISLKWARNSDRNFVFGPFLNL